MRSRANRKFGAMGETDRRFKLTMRLELVSDSLSDVVDLGVRTYLSDGDKEEVDERESL